MRAFSTLIFRPEPAVRSCSPKARVSGKFILRLNGFGRLNANKRPTCSACHEGALLAIVHMAAQNGAFFDA